MKKLFSLLTLAFVLGFSSCIEQNYPVWEGLVVEFQDAVVRSPLAGQVYPRITVANTVGTVNLQVNLVYTLLVNLQLILVLSLRVNLVHNLQLFLL